MGRQGRWLGFRRTPAKPGPQESFPGLTVWFGAHPLAVSGYGRRSEANRGIAPWSASPTAWQQGCADRAVPDVVITAAGDLHRPGSAEWRRSAAERSSNAGLCRLYRRGPAASRPPQPGLQEPACGDLSTRGPQSQSRAAGLCQQRSEEAFKGSRAALTLARPLFRMG